MYTYIIINDNSYHNVKFQLNGLNVVSSQTDIAYQLPNFSI